MESMSDPLAVELMSAAVPLARKKASARVVEARPAKPRQPASERRASAVTPVVRSAGVVREARPAIARSASAAEKHALLQGYGSVGPSKEQRAVDKLRDIVSDLTGERPSTPSHSASAAEKQNRIRPY
jgi:hypothetical protein